MFIKPSLYVLVVFNLLLTACSSVSVTTDFDRAASFTQYRTYTFVPSKEKIPLSPSTEAAFRDALRESLAAHNITEVSKDADLHVVRHISTQEKLSVYQSSNWPYQGMPYGYGYYGLWASAPVIYDVSEYTEGTLILDFVDSKTQKLVFRGIAKGTVSDQPETNAKRVREAVEKIVQKFPKTVSP